MIFTMSSLSKSIHHKSHSTHVFQFFCATESDYIAHATLVYNVLLTDWNDISHVIPICNQASHTLLEACFAHVLCLKSVHVQTVPSFSQYTPDSFAGPTVFI